MFGIQPVIDIFAALSQRQQSFAMLGIFVVGRTNTEIHK